ncbi:MAG: transcription antitermination factor NusB [Rhodospirillales bacterium]|jgi:16S rRNA (cytosine967-C5)-methyltransferase|nr:transcription antitermination factor NusB [Rhodospirillales bacterium]MDP6644519.1 transcription antitermination factor NusB [Rhodospirillales bacterium]MDP6843168.1 transcription antitermination factor NusB [Rhodospirillales bacterium]
MATTAPPNLDRRLALAALSRILDKNRHLEDALAEAEAEISPGSDGGGPAGRDRDSRDTESRDRSFAHNLVATCLRRMGQIDALIDGLLDRPMPARARAARHILRLGVAQLLFLQTPAHAVVDTAVRLAAATGQGPYKKLINAVLRRAAAEGAAAVGEQDAARVNTPGWLWDSWEAAYGADRARAIAEAHLRLPPTDLSVKSDADAWAGKLGGRVLPSGSVRLPGSVRPAVLAGFAEGAWWVQDTAASLPARLLGEARGRRIADLCAAPGGKTAQLALAGAEVIAVDRSEKRLARLSDNLRRLNLGAETVCADAGQWRPDQALDAVLLDAPCSATGSIRRHPDIQRTRRPEEVARAAEIQARLLAHAADLVRPGGTVIFATCSLQPEEGSEIIADLLSSDNRLRLSPIDADEIGGLAEAITSAGELRSLPSHLAELGGMDGFYAARLIRN